jgi:hypothetical protein
VTGIRVSSDGGETVFLAEHIAPERWNGWARPYFRLEEAHRVVAWISATPFDGESITYNKMTRRFVLSSPRVADFEYPVVTIDGFVLHGIGAGELLWEEQDGPKSFAEANPHEWARATQWVDRWIASTIAGDWRDLALVDAGQLLASAGISKWYMVDADSPFWTEVADYMTAQIASVYEAHKGAEKDLP